MNIHPITVHFPIAFFTIYSLLELVRFKKVTNLPFWFYLKACLVFVGALVSPVTVITGLMAEDLWASDKYMSAIIEKHETFALLSAGIFWVIAIAYALSWYARHKAWMGVEIQNKLVRVAVKIVEGKLVILLALIGLALITITGGIGGGMVFGPKADPFFEPIYNFIVK